MTRLIAILRHSASRQVDGQQGVSHLSFEDAARALMSASGYAEYIQKNGCHFTKSLAEMASGIMQNADGSKHRWSCDDMRAATSDMIIPKGVTLGDMTYLANMAYADLYPKVLKTEEMCVQYALAVARDPDGYDGIAFLRWTADLIGKGVTIDWEKLE